MEISDVTEAVLPAIRARRPTAETEVESIGHAEVDAQDLSVVLSNPRAIVEATGVKVSDESQIQITAKSRARRAPGEIARRIIIIIIHYSNCDADIIILA